MVNHAIVIAEFVLIVEKHALLCIAMPTKIVVLTSNVEAPNRVGDLCLGI